MLLLTAVNTIKRKSHRGNQTITSDQITTDIIACINEAARDIQKLLPKRFWLKQNTLNFTVGTTGTPAVFSLPSDCQDLSMITYVVSNVYYVIEKVESDREWLRGIWNPLVAPLRPMWMRELGPDGSGNKQIEVFPQASTSITANIEYYRLKSADLTVASINSNIPDIPDQYQDCVEKGGLYYFLKGFDDQLGQIAEADYSKAKMALEVGDERDSAGDLRIRMGTARYEIPGFRLT